MQRNLDWKLIADSYFDKAMSLAALIALFAFLVSPKFEVKPYETVVRAESVAVEIPPEIKDIVKPPETIVKPQIEIIIDSDLSGEDDEDIEIIDTIESTDIDMTEEVAAPSNQLGTTDPFAVYDDPPSPIKQIAPVYPAWAKKLGLEGAVVVDVEVFANGKVGAVNILKSLDKDMDQAAIDAVKQWEFKPAKQNGQAVAVWVRFPVNFRLEN
jgi:protein TonB